MTHRHWLATVLVAAASALLAAPAASAASDAGSPQGDSWASIAQLPDWTGSWQMDNRVGANKTETKLPLTPVYARALAKLRAIAAAHGDTPSNAKLCIPIGPLMQTPLMLSEFLFTPGQVTMISEKRDVQRIYTDGREHPANLTPSFYGHSIGHWEGKMLVADTTGLRPDGEMFYGMKTGEASKDLHVIEHFIQDGPNHIRIDVTMFSSIAFVAPYHMSIGYTRVKFPMMENVCQQNNRSIDPFTGLQRFDLKDPPPPPTQRPLNDQ